MSLYWQHLATPCYRLLTVCNRLSYFTLINFGGRSKEVWQQAIDNGKDVCRQFILCHVERNEVKSKHPPEGYHINAFRINNGTTIKSLRPRGEGVTKWRMRGQRKAIYCNARLQSRSTLPGDSSTDAQNTRFRSCFPKDRGRHRCEGVRREYSGSAKDVILSNCISLVLYYVRRS